ncbi:transposase domain-containing protein [Bradyrhizobium sp. NBAIM01]|nr:transposase domain-containing protein [Bradyrhizobium sp. NBAIM01]
MATLLQTTKMNNVHLFAWLYLTLQRIVDGCPSSEMGALRPWNHTV